MRSQIEEKYKKLFAALKNLKKLLDPHQVTIDFEIRVRHLPRISKTQRNNNEDAK